MFGLTKIGRIKPQLKVNLGKREVWDTTRVKHSHIAFYLIGLVLVSTLDFTATQANGSPAPVLSYFVKHHHPSRFQR